MTTARYESLHRRDPGIQRQVKYVCPRCWFESDSAEVCRCGKERTRRERARIVFSVVRNRI